jgi:hypothetical protein
MKSNENSASSLEKSNEIKSKLLHNLTEFYVPLTGIVSYTTLSINIMNPSLRYVQNYTIIIKMLFK